MQMAVASDDRHGLLTLDEVQNFGQWSADCMVKRSGVDDPEGMSTFNASRPAIRIAVVDDHAAVRLGLKAAIAAWPGFVCVGVAGDGEEMEPLIYRTRPDVV